MQHTVEAAHFRRTRASRTHLRVRHKHSLRTAREYVSILLTIGVGARDRELKHVVRSAARQVIESHDAKELSYPIRVVHLSQPSSINPVGVNANWISLQVAVRILRVDVLHRRRVIIIIRTIITIRTIIIIIIICGHSFVLGLSVVVVVGLKFVKVRHARGILLVVVLVARAPEDNRIRERVVHQLRRNRVAGKRRAHKLERHLT
mmetsp:Transcript_11413/g.24609  ORF Transcript_11413/g.24609 Transcript_11413/m.24609 type:complete len:205 (-) Transcript_11413:2036-2650(-)